MLSLVTNDFFKYLKIVTINKLKITPDEVEKITDSVGIVPQPNEEHDEPEDNADGVVGDLPEESARVSRDSV